MQRTDVVITAGTGRLRLTDRVPVAGSFRYEVRLMPAVDAHVGNNRADAWVEVTGGPRLILLSAYEDDPLLSVWKKQGFTVDHITDIGSLTIGQLTGAKAVIIHNVPAHLIPMPILNSLDFFVREQGGGLLMIGGARSFGAGGYSKSPIDDLLPVSMEMKNEQRKLATAMAIVMDRSGSMGATVYGGATKMDLANEGSANAIEFLGPDDQIAVYAVDTEAHEMVPLQRIAQQKAVLSSAVRRIVSTGGGIYVYQGLSRAWQDLKESPLAQKHIILFSDAADSEEPGDYINLLDEITKAGASVSVIALGTKADGDAKLLEDIGQRGQGRVFFTDQPSELPSIFSQETIAVARSAFIKEPVGALAGPGWFEVSARHFDWLPQVDAYNLSYLREWASSALITTDAYAAPLVAFGQRGLGRSAAVTFPLGGLHSALIRQWPKFGDFAQTLARWLMGEDVPPGLAVKTKVTGTQLQLDFFYDEAWEAALAEKSPTLRLTTEAKTRGQVQTYPWSKLSSGHFRSQIDLRQAALVRGAVQAGGHAVPFGPLALSIDAEWAFDPARREELRQLAMFTGGREVRDLSEVWRQARVEQFRDFRIPLLIFALVMLLLDALLTRLGWSWRPSSLHASVPDLIQAISIKKSKSRQKQLRPVPEKTPIDKAPLPIAEAKTRPSPAEPTVDEQRRARFRRAKRR
jgi:uncharacterized membrane protein